MHRAGRTCQCLAGWFRNIGVAITFSVKFILRTEAICARLARIRGGGGGGSTGSDNPLTAPIREWPN